MNCKTNGGSIYFAIKDKIFQIDEKSHSAISTILPSSENGKTSIINNIAVEENNIAVITTDKLLLLFDKKLELIEKWTINRSPSQLCMVDSRRVIIADKTGDIYLYEREKSKPDLILGHLSMILDVKLSQDFKYILSADRDEKIRVSCFPNAYNIQSFCLGHTEFVTVLEVIDCDRIVSGSGDGTVKFWNIQNGIELKSINCNEYITDKSVPTKFSQKMSDMHINIEALPVIGLQLKQISSSTLHLAVSLYTCTEIQLYEVNVSEQAVGYKFLQTIPLVLNISSFIFYNELFYIFLTQKVYIYNFDNVKNAYIRISTDEEQSNFVQTVIHDQLNTEEVHNIDDIIHVLFKKSFNNVEDYQQRKKIRLENST